MLNCNRITGNRIDSQGLKTATITINCSNNCFAPVYTDMTADTNHSSTPNLCIAHRITSVGTLSKAFSKSTKPKYSFYPLTLKFSCICLTVKMASVVPLPFINPNCISSTSICCRILCSKTDKRGYISFSFLSLYRQ